MNTNDNEKLLKPLVERQRVGGTSTNKLYCPCLNPNEQILKRPLKVFLIYY